MTRPFHLLIALLCASSLAFGIAACGGSDSTTTVVTTQTQNQNQNQNNQNQNQNNDQNNNNQNNNQSSAQGYAECMKHNVNYPQNCANIPP